MDITTERPSADLAVIALDRRARRLELRAGDRGRPDRGRAAAPTRVVLDLGGLTYMGSSGLVAIHSIALIARGREPISPDDGWQAIHDIGSEADRRGSSRRCSSPRPARPSAASSSAAGWRACSPSTRTGPPRSPPPRPDGRGPAVAPRLWLARAARRGRDRAAPRRGGRADPGRLRSGSEDADGAVVAAAGGEQEATAAEVRSEMRRPIEAAGEPVGSGRGRPAPSAIARPSTPPRRRSPPRSTLAATEAAGRRAVVGRGRDRRPPRAVAPLPARRDDRLGRRPGPDRRLRPRRRSPGRSGPRSRRCCPWRGAGRSASIGRRRTPSRPPRRRGRSARRAAPGRGSRPGRLRRARRARPADAFGSILAAVVRTTRGPQGAIVLGRARDAAGRSTTPTGGSSRRSPARPRSPSSGRRSSGSSSAAAASTTSSRSAGGSSAR